jgi:chitinase
MRISQADPAEEFAGRIAKRQTEDNGTIECSTPSPQSVHVQLARRGNRNNNAATSTSALTIMSEMSTRISSAKVDGCRTTVVFGHLNGTYAGFLSGPRIAAVSSFEVFEEALAKDLQKGAPELALVQHCGASKSQASDSDVQKDGGGVAVGLVVARDLASVHEALRLWGSAKCVEDGEGSFETDKLDMQLSMFPFTAVSTNTNPLRERQNIFECRTVDVFQGDLCPALAKRCGISLDLYYKFNTAKDHCTTLQEGQQVCCTLGRLPDRKKPPKADGSCEHYTTVADDNCSKIAISNGLTVQELGDINKKTWGWTGCNPLGLRVTLCVGLGTPPMPAAVEGASCGPTKPGTRPPVGDQTLADLNPCPYVSISPFTFFPTSAD